MHHIKKQLKRWAIRGLPYMPCHERHVTCCKHQRHGALFQDPESQNRRGLLKGTDSHLKGAGLLESTGSAQGYRFCTGLVQDPESQNRRDMWHAASIRDMGPFFQNRRSHRTDEVCSRVQILISRAQVCSRAQGLLKGTGSAQVFFQDPESQNRRDMCHAANIGDMGPFFPRGPPVRPTLRSTFMMLRFPWLL